MYQLPPLDYDYDALGSHISKEIMKLHHDNHHQTYVDRLNSALEKVPQLQQSNLTELLLNIETVPEEVRTAVRNHGGGHYNHTLFWKFMSPNGGGEPTGELADKLINKYGDFQSFTNEFETAALGVFGSGWAWLLSDLSITVTANQDSPISSGASPLLGLDVWEHAYYLDYTYNRGDYIKAWWNVVDWNYVASRMNGSVNGDRLLFS